MTVRRHADDRGSVTAEFALLLPVIVTVLLLAITALAAGGRQLRLQDVVADAARLVARGESESAAHALVADAVSQSEIRLEHRDRLVCVEARAPAGIPAVTLSARSCALADGW